MAQVNWSDAAIADVEAIRAYVGVENPAAAERIAIRILDAADTLAPMPLMGVLTDDGSRKLVVSGRYLMFYDVSMDAQLVTINAVIDGRRIP